MISTYWLHKFKSSKMSSSRFWIVFRRLVVELRISSYRFARIAAYIFLSLPRTAFRSSGDLVPSIALSS